MKRMIVVVAVTAIVMAAVMFLAFRYGGHLLGSDTDTANSVSQNQDQQQPPAFPHMELQAQFAGPLAGTVVQRWRDPVDGTICYIYLPMVVHHKPAPSGYVEYGTNSIGSISCIREPVARAQ
jgi:hypothetical protein